MYSFGADPSATVKNGVSLNCYTFTGAETLQINFTGSLSSPVQVDVCAMIESILEVSSSSLKKVSV